MSAAQRARALGGLAWHSVRRRLLSSLLTALSVALGVALVVAVDTVRSSAESSFTRAAEHGYDVILAPPHGSPMQAVLSTLFHVDEPAGTLPWSVYTEARRDGRVLAAVPYALGDTFRGHRVVGTTAELFDVLGDADGQPLANHIEGRVFRAGRFEAVVGAVAARSTGLGLGDRFRVTHGIVEGGHEHGEMWEVVGILAPTGSAHDRAVYIALDSFYEVEGHAPEPAPAAGSGGEEPGPEDGHDDGGDGHDDEGDDGHDDHDHEHGDDLDDQEHAHHALSAVGVRLKSPGLRLTYYQSFRTGGGDAQAVLPGDQVRKLLAIVGDVDRGFRVVAWLVAVVAAVGILVGLYNTIQGRRREIAVMRALGARPRHVFAVIQLEALLLCAAGAVIGLLIGHLGVSLAAPHLLEAYGIRVQDAWGTRDLFIAVAVLGLGLLAGILPAWRGLTTPVAANLHPDA